MDNSSWYGVSYVGGMCAGVLFLPLIIIMARQLGLVDIPDARKVHQKPIPRIGGLAIALSAMVIAIPVLAVYRRSAMVGHLIHTPMAAMIAASLLLLCLGVVDDLINIPAKIKLLGLLLIAYLFTAYGAQIPMPNFAPPAAWNAPTWLTDLSWLSWPITMFWLITVPISLNFTDGLDGLAGGISGVTALVIAITAAALGEVSVAILMLALAGAITAFLLFNFNPARVFMGDGGSLFIGFVIASATVVLADKTNNLEGVLIPAVTLSIPLLDTVATLLRRGILHRRSLFAAERGHIHHRLLDLGLSHRHAVYFLYVFTAAAGLLALIMLNTGRGGNIVCVLILAFLLLVLFRSAGSTRFFELIHAIRRNNQLGRESKQYRQAFEMLQLRLSRAGTFDAWWESVCQGAGMLHFSRVAMNIVRRDGNPELREWVATDEAFADAPLLQATLPIRHRRIGPCMSLDITIPSTTFLESAGHRLALFARLMEENSLANLPDKTPGPFRIRIFGGVGKSNAASAGRKNTASGIFKAVGNKDHKSQIKDRKKTTDKHDDRLATEGTEGTENTANNPQINTDSHRLTTTTYLPQRHKDTKDDGLRRIHKEVTEENGGQNKHDDGSPQRHEVHQDHKERRTTTDSQEVAENGGQNKHDGRLATEGRLTTTGDCPSNMPVPDFASPSVVGRITPEVPANPDVLRQRYTRPTANLKIAIVHDFLYTCGGAERVLEQMLEVFPQADIFSLFDFLAPDNRAFIKNKTVATSFLQKMPFARRKHRAYLPLMPMAIEQIDVSQYDMVISSSYVVAKGILTRPDQLHICYCHSPVRFAWDLQHQYLKEASLVTGIRSMAARAILHYLRLWDVRSAHGVDAFLSNSDFVGRRINKVYGRSSTTIYPPVDTDTFTLESQKADYYLTASRMVPYKRMDLIVEAFSRTPNRRLVVVGEGPEFNKIEALAGTNIKLTGRLTESELRHYMQHARAFIFAAEEDFGIVPVEAQACGTPVIAFGHGGATETVVDGVTGLFFMEHTAESLNETVDRFERMTWNPSTICASAQRFSRPVFREKLRQCVESQWREFGQRRIAAVDAVKTAQAATENQIPSIPAIPQPGEKAINESAG